MTGDIWDLYQQMQPGGWSPPPGIEGQAANPTVMSGNDAWKQAQAGQYQSNQGSGIPDTGMTGLMQQQRQNAPKLGGNMPRSNFPNAYSDFTDAQRQSMALAQARQTMNPQQFQSAFPNAVPKGGRTKQGYSTVQSPYGGTQDVPSANLQRYLDKGYTNYTPRTAAQQFDLNQSYAQGRGAPNPTIQQGAGGPYRVAGGVANPISFPNAFQTFGKNLSSGLGLMASGAGAVGNFAMNQFNNLFNRPQQPSYANTGPRRYFDY